MFLLPHKKIMTRLDGSSSRLLYTRTKMSWCNPENNSALLFFKMDEVNILKGYNRSGILTELLLSGSWKLQLDKERG